MNELIAGYASYASTQTILHEQQTAAFTGDPSAGLMAIITYSVWP